MVGSRPFDACPATDISDGLSSTVDFANRGSLFAGCRVSFHLQWATAAKPT
jgi:hypothetical protein